MVMLALQHLKAAWMEEAAADPEYMPVPYVDIRDTRIIRICENPMVDIGEKQPVEALEGVEYIIEFLMYTNYMGDSYPCYVGVLDSVVVRRDGSMEVSQTNLLRLVRSRYYISDFTGIIEEIIDLGDAFSGQLF